MEIIIENDTHVFARRKIDLVALGELCMMCQISPRFATDPLFGVVDRLIQHIETRTYGILYERSKKDDPIAVPVGFATWGFFSKTTMLIHKERYRSLRKEDLFSGKAATVLMASAPHGHVRELDNWTKYTLRDHKTVFGMIGDGVKEEANGYFKESCHERDGRT